MKQFIRNNTFETNSSSMHSLVVVKDPKPYKFHETISDYADSKEFNLFWHDDGEYGRFPFKVLRRSLDKLRYYVAHYIGFLGKEELIPKVIDFIHEQTGIDKNKINIKAYSDYDSKYDGYGYAGINDTGEDVFTYIEKNNISMEEFVLNPKYIVIVDGDEYQEFKKLFESNILNANDFEYISSGPEFWNDSIYEISLHWLENRGCDYSLLINGVSSVNKFVKEVRFNIYDNSIHIYSGRFDEIKMFVEEIKKKFPNIEISVCCNKKLYNKVKALDLSIFDYLKIRKEDYSDEIIENIKLY